jgi:hypothetical protein
MVAACPAVRLCAVGPTLKVPRMGHVHPIKPRQRLVVFPLRRKRTADWTADAASDNYAEALPQFGRGNHGRAGRTRPFRTGRCHTGRSCPASPNWPPWPLLPLWSLWPHWPRSPQWHLSGAAAARQQKGQALRAGRRACPRQPVMVRAGRWHRDGEVKGWGPPERDARWAGRPADATARTSWSGHPQGKAAGAAGGPSRESCV